VQTQKVILPPPPGLIAALTAGFESVAGSVAVIALPVLFDMFLWFGPHLRMENLFRPFLDSLPLLYSQVTSSANLEAAQQFWQEIFANFNLFSAVRTFPVGLSSLLSLEMPSLTPLGNPAAFQVGSVVEVLGWLILAASVGWLMGAVYYYWVSKITLHSESMSLGRSVIQVVFLCCIWLGILFGLGLPAVFLLSLVTLVSPAIGQVVLFLVGMAALWLLVPVYFSAHGIFTYQLNALKAILNSLRMVRYTLPTTFLFLFLLIMVGQGLRFLWTTPAQDSWWMLVGILGHAFISTALLAASFIYYRNVNNWLKVVMDQLKKQVKPALI
jgi:hypothetical protein